MKTHSHSKFGEDEPADGMHAVFASLLEQKGIDEPESFYAKACECIGQMAKAEPKDIMAFSGGLKPYRSRPDAGWKAGLFISALINGSDKPNFVLEPSGLGQTLDYIGFRNNKHLVVIGNAGSHLGWGMTDGSIYVDGDAGHEAGGRMADGQIWVQGDAGERAGCGMRGGLLHIRGQTGKDAGQERRGGTILIGTKPKAIPLPASAVIGVVEEMAAAVYHAPLEETARAPPQEPPVHYPATNARRGGSSLYVETNVKSAKDR